MAEEGFVTRAEARAARARRLGVVERAARDVVTADYAIEETRRRIVARYGGDALYEGGLYVRSTIDPTLQEAARGALRRGLATYDRRHGYRGAFARIALTRDWPAALAGVAAPDDLAPWRLAAVLGMDAEAAVIGFAGGGLGLILLDDLRWARARLESGRLGPAVARPRRCPGPRATWCSWNP